MQIVGRSCAVCGARIVTAAEGRACASCAAAQHDGCAGGHAGAGPEKPAPAPTLARPPAARSRWVTIGAPLLGVLVAASVVPRFRHWRAERRLAERAAAQLDCPADEVKVSRPRGPITAQGCGRTVQYLVVCGDIERPECLERIEVVRP